MDPRIENKFVELANRLERLEKEAAKKLGIQEIRMVIQIVKSLRLGFIEPIVTLYFHELDKFRELPEIQKIIENEIIGEERMLEEFPWMAKRNKK